MTEDEIKERAILVVNTLEAENSLVLPHYITIAFLNKEMAKLGEESPIIGIGPTAMSLIREIDRINPGLSSIDLDRIRSCLCGYLDENNYAGRYFNFRLDKFEKEEGAILVVKTLEAEKSLVLLHYLVFTVMELAIKKMGKKPPILGYDPITVSLMREIERIYPGWNEKNREQIADAVGDYLLKNNYADKYLI